MSKLMKATLVINAIDKASRVVENVSSKSIKNLNRLQRQTDRISSASFAMGRNAGQVGLALAAPIALVTRQAANFEQDVANLGAVARATEGEMAILRSTALEMGKSTKFSAIEAARGMTFLSMAGFDVQENVKAIPNVLELAAAAKLDLARAADIASNIMGQYSIKAENSSRVTNLLAATATSANANVEQIAESFKFIGPTAAALKVPIEQTAAVIGVLGDSGIQGSLAGRAFGTSLTRLTATSGKVAKAMADAGLRAFDAQGNFVGITGVVGQLERGMRGWSDQQKQATLSTIFGAEALQEINILMNKGAGELAKYERKLTGTNAAQEMMNRQLNTTMGRFTIAKSTLETLSIEIGTTFLPVLVDVLKAVQPIIEKVAVWVQENPKLTANIVKSTAAVAALSFGISGLTLAFGGIFKLVSFGASVFKWIPTILSSLNFAFFAVKFHVMTTLLPALSAAWTAISGAGAAFLASNPIGWIIAAVLGLASVTVVVIKNWDKVSVFFVKLWSDIKNLFGGFVNWVMSSWITRLMFPIISVPAMIFKHWGKITIIASNIWNRVRQIFMVFIGFIRDVWTGVGLIITDPFTNIPIVLSGLWGKFKTAGSKIMSMLWEGMKSMASKPVEVIKEVAQKIRNFLPFSPAKEGALKDIHKVRIIETIAETMNPKPMVNAMRMATTAAAVTVGLGASGAAAGSPQGFGGVTNNSQKTSSGIVINYNPSVTINGGATPETQADFMAQLKNHEMELLRLVEQAVSRKQRKSF